MKTTRGMAHIYLLLIIVILVLFFSLYDCMRIEPPPIGVSGEGVLKVKPSPLPRALNWRNLAWDETLLERIKLHQTELESDSQGLMSFCPKYWTFLPDERTFIFASLAVAIARFESAYRPTAVYREPMGYDSIGLFQLSYQSDRSYPDCHGIQESKDSLKDPSTNIICAVSIMATLIDRDKILTAGCNSGSARGLARYWSTMRSSNCGRAHPLEDIRKIVMRQKGCQ